MFDQYGYPIPDDLLVLDAVDPDYLSDDELLLVDRARWYETPNGYILVPFEDVIDVGPIELFGFIRDYDDIDMSELVFIDPVLHRFSGEDGFYHA